LGGEALQGPYIPHHKANGCMHIAKMEGTHLISAQLSSVRVPKLQPEEKMYTTVPKRVYGNAHAYHINSISVNSDNAVCHIVQPDPVLKLHGFYLDPICVQLSVITLLFID
jgi:hypothetical protein